MAIRKRGQHSLGLPFVFIISLIVAALIVLFSIYTIKSFTCTQEQITINLFVSDLREEVEKSFFTTPGSQTIFKGRLPTGGCADIEQVCFAFPDRAKDPQFSDEVWFEISGYSRRDVQLFLYPRDGLQKVGVQQAYNINPERSSIEVIENPTCFQNKGKIEIFLKNEGRHVLISR